jgi:uncharacterized membrane protein YebE (DUF533 family)
MMPGMAERDRILASLRVWIATAWADGTIAEPERDALHRLIGYAQISEAEQAEARTWLESPIELDVGDLHELSIVRRQFIYRVAAALTRVDLEVDSAERALLVKLRAALDLSDTDASQADDLELA